MMVPCEMCDEPVDADALGTYAYVQGWEINRKGGGTNALRLRKPLYRYAHKTCVEVASRGKRGQTSLAM
jgi:hypothetical protein